MKKLNWQFSFIVFCLAAFSYAGSGCSSNPKKDPVETPQATSSEVSYEDSMADSDDDLYADSSTLETYSDSYESDDSYADTSSDTYETTDADESNPYISTTDDDYSTSTEETASEIVESELPAKESSSEDTSYTSSNSTAYTESSDAETSYSDTSSYSDTGSAGYSQTATSGSTIYYTVEKGDTLMEIAFDHYGAYSKWESIYNDNSSKMQSPRLMQVGSVLTLNNVPQINITKNGDPYTVQKNDTLQTISQKLYGTTTYWRSLWQNNPELIKDPDKIYVGFKIYYDPQNALSVSQQQQVTESNTKSAYSDSSAMEYEEDSSGYETSDSEFIEPQGEEFGSEESSSYSDY